MESTEKTSPAAAQASGLKVRRLSLHVALAMVTTPLPGAGLVAARLFQTGRTRPALALAAGVLGGFFLAATLAMTAPTTAPVAASLVGALWFLGGLLTAWIEVRNELVPGSPDAGEPRRWSRTWIWGLAVPVGAIPMAFLLASFTSRWGMDLFAKPSMPSKVLWTAALTLFPVGCLVGWLRALLRAPRRFAAPINFALGLWLSLVTWLLPLAFFLFLISTLLEIDFNLLSWGLPLWMQLFSIWVFSSFWLALAVFLSDATGFTDFFVRWAAIAFLGSFFWGNFMLVDSSLPLALAGHRAGHAAEEGHHQEAARRWLFSSVRSGHLTQTTKTLLDGAREALLAEDRDLARRLLERLDALAEVLEIPEAEVTAAAMLGSGLRLDEVHRVDVRPVVRDANLNNSWAAFLTAVAAAMPGEPETRLKEKVRGLSWSAENFQPPSLWALDDLRVAAAVFGFDLVAVPGARRSEALAAGLPLLFRDLGRDDWSLLFYQAPGANAVLILDYNRWRDDASLEASEVEKLIAGEEDLELPARRNLSRLSRLAADSRLLERLDQTGRPFFALARREENEGAEAAPHTARIAAFTQPIEELLIEERARIAFYQRSRQRFNELLERIGPGRPRRELLAAASLAKQWRPLDGALAEEAREAADELLDQAGLTTATYWFLYQVEAAAKRDPELGCRWQDAVTRRRLELFPFRGNVLKRLEQKVELGDLDAVLELAPRYVVAHSWNDEAILSVLEQVATIRAAKDRPEVRKMVSSLVARLAWFPSLEDEELGRPRSAFAPYCAARALLAERADEAVRWWRRAVELEPKKPLYRERLADALADLGQGDESALVRRRAAAVKGLPRCESGAGEG